MLEPLERRELLTASDWRPLPLDDTGSELRTSDTLQHIMAGDVQVSVIDWTGRAAGDARLETSERGTGFVVSSSRGEMPKFQVGQSLSFQVDRPAEITFIQFANFHAEDADKAELRIGADSFVIHGSDVSYGMWRPSAPLHIRPEDVIALVALAPTDEDLKVAEEARAERLDELAAEGEDQPATMAAPAATWQLGGISLGGEHERTRGGYGDFTQVTTGEILEVPLGKPDVIPKTAGYYVMDGHGAEHFSVSPVQGEDGKMRAGVTLRDPQAELPEGHYWLDIYFFDGAQWRGRSLVTVEVVADEFEEELRNDRVSDAKLLYQETAIPELASKNFRTDDLTAVERRAGDGWWRAAAGPDEAMRQLVVTVQAAVNDPNFQARPSVRRDFYERVSQVLAYVNMRWSDYFSADRAYQASDAEVAAATLLEKYLAMDLPVEGVSGSGTVAGNSADQLRLFLRGILPADPTNLESLYRTADAVNVEEITGIGTTTFSRLDADGRLRTTGVDVQLVGTVTVSAMDFDWSRLAKVATARAPLPAEAAAAATAEEELLARVAEIQQASGIQFVVETNVPRAAAGGLPDLSVNSFTVNPYDRTQFRVDYTVTGTVSGNVDVAIYRSFNGTSLDELLMPAVSVSASTGNHVATLTADFVDIEQDYSLIAVVDPPNGGTGAVSETNEGNNTRPYSGYIFKTIGGDIHVQAQTVSEIDNITLSSGYGGAATLVWKKGPSGSSYDSYSLPYGGATSGFRIRTHSGSDYANLATAGSVQVWGFGGAGNDSIYGASGQDLLMGGDGADNLYGGSGDDRIYGGDPSESEESYGGAVEGDFLYGQYGNDWLDGGVGADRIDGGHDNDTIFGGNETGGGSMPWVLGSLFNGGGFFDGGGGDWLVGSAGKDTIYGGQGNDYIDGSNDDDVLYGGVGNDYLRGGLHADVLYGEEGDDLLEGQDGDDRLYGNNGADRLYGSNHNDFLQLGSGLGKVAWGGAGDDVIMGSESPDTVYGEAGDDTIWAFDGADVVDGGSGGDYINGGSGNDQLQGGVGNDTLVGEAGIDTLSGGDGDDRIDGGDGGGTLDGGAGYDTIDEVPNAEIGSENHKPVIEWFGTLFQEIADEGTVHVIWNGELSFQVAAYDPDGDEIEYSYKFDSDVVNQIPDPTGVRSDLQFDWALFNNTSVPNQPSSPVTIGASITAYEKNNPASYEELSFNIIVHPASVIPAMCVGQTTVATPGNADMWTVDSGLISGDWDGEGAPPHQNGGVLTRTLGIKNIAGICEFNQGGFYEAELIDGPGELAWNVSQGSGLYTWAFESSDLGMVHKFRIRLTFQDGRSGEYILESPIRFQGVDDNPKDQNDLPIQNLDYLAFNPLSADSLFPTTYLVTPNVPFHSEVTVPIGAELGFVAPTGYTSDPLTVQNFGFTELSIDKYPTKGTLTIEDETVDGTWSFTYIPNPDAIGIDEVRFVANYHGEASFPGTSQQYHLDSVTNSFPIFFKVAGAAYVPYQVIPTPPEYSPNPACGCGGSHVDPLTGDVGYKEQISDDFALVFRAPPEDTILRTKFSRNESTANGFRSEVAVGPVGGTLLPATAVYHRATHIDPAGGGTIFRTFPSRDLSTGPVEYHLTLETSGSSGTPAIRKTYSGVTPTVGHDDVGFGRGWAPANYERLSFAPITYDTSGDAQLPSSAFWVRGNGAILRFNGNGLAIGDDDATAMTIEESAPGNWHLVLTDKSLSKKIFNLQGYLTRTVDRFGNETLYSYATTSTNNTVLAGITRERQNVVIETITFVDNPTGDGRYDSIVSARKINGTTVTRTLATLSYQGNRLTSITRFGDNSNPTQFGYGGNGELKSVNSSSAYLTFTRNVGNNAITTKAHISNLQGVEPYAIDTLIPAQTSRYREAYVYNLGDKFNAFQDLASADVYAATYPVIRKPVDLVPFGLPDVNRREGIEIGSDGVVIRRTYDAFGYLKTESRSDGTTTTNVRNGETGYVTKTTRSETIASQLHETVLTYFLNDDGDYVEKQEYNVDGINQWNESWTYDVNDNDLIFHRDRQGLLTKFTGLVAQGGTTPTSYRQVVTTVVGLQDTAQGPYDDILTEILYSPDGQLWKESYPAVNSANPTFTTRAEYIYTADYPLQSSVKSYPNTNQSLPEPITQVQYGNFDWFGNPWSVTDAMGRATSHTFDSQGRQKTTTTPNPGGAGGYALSTENFYDSKGRLDYVINASTNSTSNRTKTQYVYDDYGNVWKTIQSYIKSNGDEVDAGTTATTESTYDPATGKLLQTKDDLDRITRYYYDALGRTVMVEPPDPDSTGPLQTPYSYTAYDEAGRLLMSIDALHNVTSYSYDSQGRLKNVTSPDGTSTSNYYSANGQLAYTADTLARVTTYSYDSLGRQTQVVLPNPGAGYTNLPIVSHYDDVGQLEWTTDQLGRRTDYEYDLFGRLSKQIAPYPDASSATTRPETRYDYYADGQIDTVTEVTDYSESTPVTRVTTYEYDGMGRTQKVTLPAPGTSGAPAPYSIYVYDDLGNLKSVKDASGNGDEYTYTYRNGNALVSQVTELYNGASRTVMTYAYDKLGNVVSETDEISNATTYQYLGGVDLVMNVTQPNGDKVIYGYDVLGRRTSLTDGEIGVGNETSWTYDAAGRTLSETTANGTESFVYDRAGRLIEKTDRNGRVTEYTYDVADRMKSERWRDANGATVKLITFGYDSRGQLNMVADDDHTYLYSYDLLGRRDEAQFLPVGMSQPVKVTSTFDLSGARKDFATAIGSTSPTLDFRVDFGLDKLGRVTSMTQRDGISGPDVVTEKHITFNYNDRGLLQDIVRYAGTSSAGTAIANTAYTYHTNGRLDTLSHRSGSSSNVLVGYEYDYDATNRINKITVTGAHPDETVNYNYDPAGQLTDADYNPAGPAEENYVYTNHGNRTVSGGSGPYSYDEHHRLLQDALYAYTYDDEGNRITRTKLEAEPNEKVVTHEYEWDHRNRLVEVRRVENPGHIVTDTVTYAYDWTNQLISRRLFDGDDETGVLDSESYYIYDQGQVILEFDGPGVGDVSNRYLWAPAVDQLLAAEQEKESSGSDVHWTMGDHLGTIRDIITHQSNNPATTVTTHRVYDAFGNLIETTSGSVSLTDLAFAYTGRMFDSETGLQNNLHRWYDPGTGRWISEDPIGFAAGDANLYRYVGNASTIYVDAMGLHRGLGNSYFENWIETQFSQARSGISDALRNVAEAANQAIAPVIAPIIAGFEEWKDYARRKGQWQSDRRWKLREGNLHLFEFNAQAGYGYRVTGTGESVTVVGHGFGQFEGKVAFVWGTKLVGRLNVRLQGTWTYVVCAPAAEWSIDAGINVSFSFGLQYKFGAVTRIGGASVTAEGGFGFSNFYSFKEKKWGEWKGTLYGRAYAEWKTGWWGSLRRREIRFTYGGELGID